MAGKTPHINVRRITDFVDEESVFKNAKILSEDYIPNTDKFLFREEEINSIMENLTTIFNGFPPNNMFIYGPPSTGKTHIMLSIIDALNEYSNTYGQNAKFIYINSGGRTAPQVLVEVANKLGLNAIINMGINIISLIEKNLHEEKNYFFVFDEFDRMKRTPQYPNPYDTIVNPFTRMGSHVRIAVIVNNYKIYDKFDAPTKSSYSPLKLYFRAYNINETIHIIKDRCKDALKEGVIDDDTIIEFGKWIHKSGVDLRTAFKVIFRAGRRASMNKRKKIVYEDLQQAFREVEQDMLKSTLSKLNDAEFLFIHSIALAQKEHNLIEVEKNKVYQTYVEVCRSVGVSPLSWKHLSTYICPKIEMQGIIKTDVHGRGKGKGISTFFSIDSLDTDEMLKMTEVEMNRRFGRGDEI